MGNCQVDLIVDQVELAMLSTPRIYITNASWESPQIHLPWNHLDTVRSLEAAKNVISDNRNITKVYSGIDRKKSWNIQTGYESVDQKDLIPSNVHLGMETRVQLPLPI